MYGPDWKRWNHLESEWADIEASYRLAPFQSPINLRQEKSRLLSAVHLGETYNPRFEFDIPPDFPTKRIRQFIADLDPDRSWLEQIYYDIANMELLNIQSVQTHDSNLITGFSSINYGLPGFDLLTKAQYILENTVSSDQKENQNVFTAHEAAHKLQLVLDRSGLQNWQAIVFEPMNAKMSVSRLDKQVKVKVGETFSQQTVDRLIVHELGIHVIRYHNGSHQPIRLFQNGFSRYLATEEGLAIFIEEKVGLLKPDNLRKYAGRVIAAHLAINQSFNDVFNTLCHWFKYDTAFDVVVRAKRGFTDTSQPGANTKDLVYLQGYLVVKKHLEHHPEDYDLLFLGKFGLKHLPLVRSLWEHGFLVSPKMLPEHLMGDSGITRIVDRLK